MLAKLVSLAERAVDCMEIIAGILIGVYFIFKGYYVKAGKQKEYPSIGYPIDPRYYPTNSNLDNTPLPEYYENLKNTIDNFNKLESYAYTIGYSDDVTLDITSGYRSKAVNKKVGGVASSYHAKGQAIDFTSNKIAKDPVKFITAIWPAVKSGKFGVVTELIAYPKKKFVHIAFGDKHIKAPMIKIDDKLQIIKELI